VIRRETNLNAEQQMSKKTGRFFGT